MTLKHLLVGAAMGLISTSAAIALGVDEDHAACMEAAGGITVRMLDCIGKAYERADAALNALWETEMPDTRPELAAPLRKAQRDWIVYRDTTCVAEAAIWEGGTFASVALSDCRLRITEERLEWLGNVFSPEGE